MTRWYAVYPRERTNYVSNPSLEYATTGWAGVNSASITRSQSEQYSGAWALQVTTGWTTNGGAEVQVSIPSSTPTSGQSYAGSLAMRGIAGTSYTLEALVGGTVLAGTAVLSDGDWQRPVVLFAAGTTATGQDVAHTLRLRKTNSTANQTIYLDAAQVEPGTVATTYLDGDQDDCRWLGEWHNSRSWRSGQTRRGGELIPLDETLGVVVSQETGIGLPSVQHLSDQYAMLPGGWYQGMLGGVREIQLAITIPSDDLIEHQAIRRDLMALIVPDGRPTRLMYLGASVAQWIDVYYKTGLEGTDIGEGQYWENTQSTLLAPDPAFRTQVVQRQSLPWYEQVNFAGIIYRYDGYWRQYNSILPLAVTMHQQEIVYIRPAGMGRALYRFHPDRNSVVVSTSVAGYNTPYALVPATDGFYVLFSTADNLNSGVEHYNPETDTWKTILTISKTPAFAATSFAVVSPDEIYLVAGLYAYRWDGSTTQQFGPMDGPTYRYVRTIDKTSTGKIWMWSTPASGSGLKLHEWENATQTLTEKVSLAFGGYSTISSTAVTNEDVLYTVMDGNTIYRFDGETYERYQAFAAGSSAVVDVDQNGNLLIYGQQSFLPDLIAGRPPAVPVTLWNGKVFTALPLDVENMAPQFSVLLEGTTIATFLQTTVTRFPSRTVITNSQATRTPFVLVMTGPAYLRYLENGTNNAVVTFDLDILLNETVTFDTEQRTIVSDIRGNRTAAIIPGSDVLDMVLEPGENIINLFATDVGGNATAELRWKNSSYTADY